MRRRRRSTQPLTPVAERLQEAVGERFGNVSQFQIALKKAAGPEGLRGDDYGSVYNYVTGKYDPPLRWLEVAAQVLGVREAWLAFGEGTRTGQSKVTGFARPAWAKAVEEQFAAGFPEYSALPEWVRWVVWETWHVHMRVVTELLDTESFRIRRIAADQDGKGDTLDDWRRIVARRVAHALAAPLSELRMTRGQMPQTRGGDPPDQLAPLEPWQLQYYTILVCQGLQVLAPTDKGLRGILTERDEPLPKPRRKQRRKKEEAK